MEWACVVSASGAADYNEDHELGSRENFEEGG